MPEPLWVSSLAAGWAATAAVAAAYTAAEASPPAEARRAVPVAELIAGAAATADPHAIKLADAAIDVYAHTNAPTTISAALDSVHLIAAD
nr:hypothetical protein [Micromonospora sp. DSM 115978]